MGDNNNQNVINEVTSLIRRWEEERTPPTYDPVPTLTKYVFQDIKLLFVLERVLNNVNHPCTSYHYVFLSTNYL